MTTYAFFRAIAALCGTLDVATRFTGVAIQILIVYTGYLIPPSSMHPWFAWLRWINWVQYGFECLMANEFTGLDLQCVPPYLVPQGPNIQSQYQSCTLAGSQPGQNIVNGADYIQASFTYSRSHLWRNFGFLWAFFFAFVVLTMFGMERMQPNAGGAAVTMFKRGQVPKKIEQTIETGGHEKKDEETGPTTHIAEKQIDSSEGSDKDDKPIENIAKNETVFTFQNINYEIPYEKGTRKLLSDVQGFVRPGKLTALMGASGEFAQLFYYMTNTLRRWQDHLAQYPRPAHHFRHNYRRFPRRRPSTAQVLPTSNRFRRTDGYPRAYRYRP